MLLLWTCRWMAGGGWSSHSWKAPAGLFLAHSNSPVTSLSGPSMLGSQPPHKRALCGRARAARRIFIPHSPPFPRALAGVCLQVQEAGKRGCGPDGNQRSGCKRQPHLRSRGFPAPGASSLSLPSGPQPYPCPLIPAPSLRSQAPHFPVFSPSPSLFLPGWVSESYGEPGR